MGRVSTAVEVVMTTPQAVSLALGSAARGGAELPGDLLDHGAVTLLAAAYIALMLRDQIRGDVRRPVAAPVEVGDVSLPGVPVRQTTEGNT